MYIFPSLCVVSACLWDASLFRIFKNIKFKTLPLSNGYLQKLFCVEDDRKIVFMSCQNLDLKLSKKDLQKVLK